jgi:hypothetical protein
MAMPVYVYPNTHESQIIRNRNKDTFITESQLVCNLQAIRKLHKKIAMKEKTMACLAMRNLILSFTNFKLGKD